MGSTELPVKKIYIDSKFRRPDSISSSNFKVDLPYTLKLPESTIFFVDDVCIPHSWRTVEENMNNKIYLRLSSGGVHTDYIIILTAQNYNGSQLASELSSRINFHTINQPHTCVYNSQTQTISLSFANFDCRIFTDDELLTLSNWTGNAYNSRNLTSANQLLNNTRTSSTGTTANPLEFYLSLQPVRNVYMRSPNLTSFTTIGPDGSSSIVKKVPVTSNYGEMIFSNITSGSDFLDCGRATWRTLEFHLLDVNSNYIDLHGANISFSLVLDKK